MWGRLLSYKTWYLSIHKLKWLRKIWIMGYNHYNCNYADWWKFEFYGGTYYIPHVIKGINSEHTRTHTKKRMGRGGGETIVLYYNNNLLPCLLSMVVERGNNILFFPAVKWFCQHVRLHVSLSLTKCDVVTSWVLLSLIITPHNFRLFKHILKRTKL